MSAVLTKPARPVTTGRQLRSVMAPFAPTIRGASSADGPIGFSGHAVVYDSWTTVRDFFGDFEECIQRGATERAIAEDDVRLLMNHDPNFVLARKRGEPGDTLRLSDDATGMVADAELAPTSYARDLAICMQRGDVSGMSFAFEVLSDDWAARPDGVWMRTITEVRLYDVSIVTYPAYEETDAALRALMAVKPEMRRALIALRAGKRNSVADELVIRSAAESVRQYAGDLESVAMELDGLLSGNNTNDDERALRSAMADDDARHHRAMAAYLGIAR